MCIHRGLKATLHEMERKVEMMLSCKVSLAMHNAFFLPYLVAFFFWKMVENLCEDVTYKRRKKKEM